MRDYEAMFIFHPELTDEKLTLSIQAVETIIKNTTGGEPKIESLGKKTLAYKIKKMSEGFYVSYDFQAPPAAIVKINAELKHSDDILRYMIFAKELKK